MKEQILKIAQDLEQGTITETEAQNLLLDLFGVISSSNKCNDCKGDIDKDGICFCNR
jgi:hypothetical protein